MNQETPMEQATGEALKVAQEAIKVAEAVMEANADRKKRDKKNEKSVVKKKKARAAVRTGSASRREKKKTKDERKKDRKRQQKHRAAKTKKSEGPAFEVWKKRLRAERTPGQCLVKGCSTKPPSPLSKMCLGHKKEYRRLQLKLNNVVWRRRVKSGEAGHHVVYDGRATEWATKDRLAAKRVVSEGKSIVPTVKEFEQILSKTTTETNVKNAKQAAKAKKTKKAA